MVCIYVDNLEHLYLTNDYIVTHNTTLVKYIISALGVNPKREVAYCSLTGKAATVLKQKGCANAITAHKLLYDAELQEDDTYVFCPRPILEKPYKVIVCDEISMLPLSIWKQLLSHPVYVIGLGDPAQLPPVSSEDNNHLLEHPHIFLDEIMRQALDSEIIRFSMWVRQGKSISSYPCDNQEVKILQPDEVNSGVYLWGDQILCATNQTRNIVNSQIRLLRGYDVEPQVGDKIVSLKNHWDFVSDHRSPLTNGTIGTITTIYPCILHYPPWIATKDIPAYMLTMADETGEFFYKVCMDKTCLKTGQGIMTPNQLMKLKKNSKFVHVPPPYDFAYAYALTVWKAQGSQWPKVVGITESFPQDLELRKKFLYTLATRASEKLVIINN